MEKAVIFITANETVVSNKLYDYRDEILVDVHTGELSIIWERTTSGQTRLYCRQWKSRGTYMR